jgi:hypothetical protein
MWKNKNIPALEEHRRFPILGKRQNVSFSKNLKVNNR